MLTFFQEVIAPCPYFEDVTSTTSTRTTTKQDDIDSVTAITKPITTLPVVILPEIFSIQIGGGYEIYMHLKNPAEFLSQDVTIQILFLDILYLIFKRGLYAVIRFRLIEKTIKLSFNNILLDLLHHAIHSTNSSPDISKRIVRLIALASSANITPRELQKLLQFLRKPSLLTISLLQALNQIVQSSDTYIKPPTSFFLFAGRGSGLIANKIDTNFLSRDLQVLFWFRVENMITAHDYEDYFDQGVASDFHESRCLFRCTDGSHYGVGVFLRGSSLVIKYTNDDAATEEVIVPNFDCLEQVWYHLSVSFVKPKFLLYNVDEIRVSIDNQILLNKSATYYRWQKDTAVQKELTLAIGADFDGEIGPIYIFSELLTPQAAEAVSTFSSGNMLGVKGQGVYSMDLERDVLSIPAEDSRASTPTPPVLLVYNPVRVLNGYLLDVHGNCHACLNRNTYIWSINTAKDALSTLGGISCLLPLLPKLAIENGRFRRDVCEKDPENARNIGFGTCLTREAFDAVPLDVRSLQALRGDVQQNKENGIIGLILSLFAQFLRFDEISQLEFVRLNGVDMIVYALTHISAPLFVMENDRCLMAVNLLLEACTKNVKLESAIVKGLLVNFSIWVKANEETQRRMATFIVNAMLGDQYNLRQYVTVETALRQIELYYAKQAVPERGLLPAPSIRRFASIDNYTFSPESSPRPSPSPPPFSILSAHRKYTIEVTGSPGTPPRAHRKTSIARSDPLRLSLSREESDMTRSLSSPDLLLSSEAIEKRKKRLFHLDLALSSDAEESALDDSADAFRGSQWRLPPSVPASPRSPRRVLNTHLEKSVSDEEDKQQRTREHRAYMRKQWYCVLLQCADRPGGLEVRDVEVLLAALGHCDDTDTLFELAELFLFIILRKGSAFTNIVTQACKFPENFASFVLFKIVSNPKESVRSVGVRILTHYYLRLDKHPSSSFKIISSNKEGLEFLHHFGGVEILATILFKYQQGVGAPTYSALLEMFLLTFGSKRAAIFTEAIREVEIRPDSSFQVPPFVLQLSAPDAEDAFNVFLLPVFLECVVAQRNESLKHILRDVLVILQNNSASIDAWLSLPTWHTYLFRVSCSIIDSDPSTHSRISSSGFSTVLHNFAGNALPSGSTLALRRRSARLPLKQRTSFLNWLSVSKALASTETTTTTTRLTKAEYDASHESFSFLMEIYCTLLMHSLEQLKRCRDVAAVLEYTRSCKNGSGIGLTILSYLTSKIAFNVHCRKINVSGVFSETFVRTSRAKMSSILSLLSVATFHILADYGWIEGLKAGVGVRAEEESDSVEPDFSCDWTYFCDSAAHDGGGGDGSGDLNPSREAEQRARVERLERMLFLEDELLTPPGEISNADEAKALAVLHCLKMFDSIFWSDDQARMSNLGMILTLKRGGMFTEAVYSNVLESVVVLVLTVVHDHLPFSLVYIKNLRRLRLLLKGAEVKDFTGTGNTPWLCHILSQTVLLLGRLRYSILPVLDRLDVISDPATADDQAYNAEQFETLERDPQYADYLEGLFDSDFGARFYDVCYNAFYLLIAIFEKDSESLSNTLCIDSYGLLVAYVERLMREVHYTETEAAFPDSPSAALRNKEYSINANDNSNDNNKRTSNNNTADEDVTAASLSSDESEQSWDWMDKNKHTPGGSARTTSPGNPPTKHSKLSVRALVKVLSFLCDVSLSKSTFRYQDIFHTSKRTVPGGEGDPSALYAGSTKRSTDLTVFNEGRISRREVPDMESSAAASKQPGSEVNTLPLWNSCLSFFDAAWSPWFSDTDDSVLRYELTRHRDNYLRRMVFTRKLTSNDYANCAYSQRGLGVEVDDEEDDALRLSERVITNKEVLDAQLTFFKPAQRQPGGAGDEDVEKWGDDIFKALVSKSTRPVRKPRVSINSSMFAGSAPTTPTGRETATKPDWVLTFDWAAEERQVYSAPASLVTLERTLSGTLLLTNKHLFFHPSSVAGGVILESSGDHLKTRRWVLECLLETYGRRYLLQNCGIELFFADSPEVFVALHSLKELQSFFYNLRRQHVPRLISPAVLNPRGIFAQQQWTELWRQHLISNFEYILRLNLMAGRSFSDISQYPVFPWVLADYKSATLDLSNPVSFRDLRKPIGALSEHKLKNIMERYNSFDDVDVPQFMYGSHYSSAGVVLQYMIRQEPYTKMAVNFQGGRFDVPDRLFYDLGGTWNSLMTSVSDVKELIPEFFFCPEMFLNSNTLPLGELQDGNTVDNVKLPPWAKDPYDFVRLHRDALESDYVSENLHHWIDLIFGYKQTGPAAIEAHNLFYYLTYENAIDIDEIEDPILKEATICQVVNFGQTPSQLCDHAHPARRARSECPYWFSAQHADTLVCISPSKQAFSEYCLSPVVSIRSAGDRLVTFHADATMCYYKLTVTRGATGALSLAVAYERVKKLDVDAKKLRALELVLGEEEESPTSPTSPTAVPVASNNFLSRLDGSVMDLSANKSLLAQRTHSPRSGAKHMSSSRRSSTSSTLSLSSLNSSSTHAFTAGPGGSGASYFAVTLDSPQVALSVGGGRVVTCGYWDNALRVHSLDSAREVSSAISGHVGAITCVALDRQGGSTLVTGGEDGTCRVWVLENASVLQSFYDELRPAGIDSGFYDSSLVCLHVLCGHLAPISCLFFSVDMDLVVSASEDGTLCLHSVRTGAFIRTVVQGGADDPSGAATPFHVATISSQGYIAAHSWSDMRLRVFWINGQELASVDTVSRIKCLTSNAKSDLLICGQMNGCLLLYKLHNLELVRTIDWSVHGCISSLWFTLDNNFLLVGSEDGSFSICTDYHCARTQ